MFVKILTADDKNSLLNGDNLKEPLQILLSDKQKGFLQIFFFLHFRNLA